MGAITGWHVGRHNSGIQSVSSSKAPHRFVDYMATLKVGIPEHQLRELAFYGGVSDPDDATATIRGMAHIEAQLLELVRRNLERPSLIKVNDFSLDERILWARALGEIGDKTASAIRALARIRNKLAHNHTEVFADTELIGNFIKAARELPTAVTLNYKLPDDVKAEYEPPMTDLRWQMRMGITAVSQQVFNLLVLPPLRTRVRPTEPSIPVLPTYTPQPPL